ncbi:unnamed protein product, partial [Nesidiocoris tenuis]
MIQGGAWSSFSLAKIQTKLKLNSDGQHQILMVVELFGIKRLESRPGVQEVGNNDNDDSSQLPTLEHWPCWAPFRVQTNHNKIRA